MLPGRGYHIDLSEFSNAMKNSSPLTIAVESSNLEEVRELLQENYSDALLAVNLLIALKNGQRRISNLLFEKLKYNPDPVIKSLALKTNPLVANKESGIILDRFIDLMSHNNVTPTFNNIRTSLYVLNHYTQEEVSRLFEYALQKTHLTRNQYKELLGRIHDKKSPAYKTVEVYSKLSSKMEKLP